jgi:glycosyltransferase involved in cell wall biosynthesis
MNRSVSVVIPTRNRTAILTKTLRALFDSAPHEELEVLVVDDGDGDASGIASLFANDPLRVVRSAGRGAAAARNCGAALARHEFLMFLDDDIILTPGNIQRHLDTHERFPRALVSGMARPDVRVVEEAAHTAFGRYKLRFDYPLDNADRIASLGEGVFQVARVASFNLSMDRRDFLAVARGFDERFPYAGCEDQEFSFRARARGLELLLDERICCFHNEIDRLLPEAWFHRQHTGVQGAVLLAHLYPLGKEHPVYRAFSCPSRRDPLKVVLRKTAVALLTGKLLSRMILKILLLLERWRVPDPVLFKGYHLLWAIHMHTGFREGLRRLDQLEAPRV